MAKLFTISEILELDPDSPIHCLRGTVKKQWPRKTGRGKFGEWSFESFILEDKKGDEIKITFKDRPPAQDMEGEDILIIAKQGKQGKWTGVTAVDDEYKGETTRVVHVTKSAEVIVGNDAEPGAEEEPGGEPERQPEENDRKEEPEAPAVKPGQKTKEAENILKVKAKLLRATNLMNLCLDAAVFVGTQFEARHKMSMSPEQFQAITSSFFIFLKDEAVLLPWRPMEFKKITPAKPEEKPKKK